MTEMIAFIINFFFLLQGNSLLNAKNVEKCFDDPNGITPYVVPQGQSILYYDPDVIIDKNQPYSACSWVPQGYTQNPEKDCPLDSQYILTPIIPILTGNLMNIINRIEQVILNSSSNRSIISLQSIGSIHCSLDYYSCYNYSEYLTIETVLENFQWNSFTIRFNKVSCHVTTLGSYLVVEADLLSQKKLFSLVRKLERQISNQGIQIKIPRIEKFHMSLAFVNYTYPSNCIINILKRKLISKLKNQEFGTIRVCCFITIIRSITTYYYAQDCDKNYACALDIQ